MTDALAAVVDVRLRPPRQGDGDDGHGLLLDGPGYDRWASLLATGAALFGPAPWWPAVPGGDVRTALWTRLAARPLPGGAAAGAPAVAVRGRRHGAPARHRNGQADELWCRADHGPHGYLSIAAHAHADALAIEVRVGGVDVLADPGTYCYGADPAWRAYFRSTLAHNTLEVGGVDQSRGGRPPPLDAAGPGRARAAPAGWTAARWPSGGPPTTATGASARRPSTTGASGWTGEHAGWSSRTASTQRRPRLPPGLPPGPRRRLHPRRSVGPSSTWRADHGQRGATLALPDALAWRCLEGQTDPPAGWYSPSFGVRVPSVTLLGSGRVGPGQALTTVLQLDPGSTP